jgi:hypothetical protein
VNCALRRGAWYRAVRLTRENVLLEVMREQVPVPRRLVKTTFAQPARWSVVPRPADAVNFPDGVGLTLRGVPELPGSRAAQRFSAGTGLSALSGRVRRRMG